MKFTIKSQKSNEEKVSILCNDARVQPKWTWVDILVVVLVILIIGGLLLAIVILGMILVQEPDPTPIITNNLEVIEITCENRVTKLVTNLLRDSSTLRDTL